jgi:hypothetical protein
MSISGTTSTQASMRTFMTALVCPFPFFPFFVAFAAFATFGILRRDRRPGSFSAVAAEPKTARFGHPSR